MSPEVTVFLGGDVMLGRGIDQILPHRSDPTLHEPVVDSALAYVELAERVSGPIPRGVACDYVWGDALAELERLKPELRVINLETAVTRSDVWVEKGINYRVHPRNVGCLAAARIDCCVLANNHVLDYTRAGLDETLHTLRAAGFATAGAGHDLQEARAPAIVPMAGGGRALVFGLASVSSGVPANWAATENRSGLHLIEPASDVVADIAQLAERLRRPGDIVIASIHWGENWGYSVPTWQRRLARDLVERASVDVVHGHSAHHPKAIEVYKEKLILYGCGDLLNDYEGISGYEEYRDDLALMYFPALSRETGSLLGLRITPMRIERFSLRRAREKDALWLAERLSRESRRYGAYVSFEADGTLSLSWTPPAAA